MLCSLAAVDELTIGTDQVTFDRVVIEVVNRLLLVLNVATGGRRRLLGKRHTGGQGQCREHGDQVLRHGVPPLSTTVPIRSSENSSESKTLVISWTSERRQ